MNLQETIKINKEILALMESKYEGPFPTWSTGPESRYYNYLLRDTQKAEESLKHGGLVSVKDEGSNDALSV